VVNATKNVEALFFVDYRNILQEEGCGKKVLILKVDKE
jgi:hypothetical protein